MTAMTLTEFLLARIAEDEADADERHTMDCAKFTPPGFPCDCGYPARVLAGCEAKRQIVIRYVELTADESNLDDHGTNGEIIGLGYALGALALPDADHPDYREEWKP